MALEYNREVKYNTAVHDVSACVLNAKYLLIIPHTFCGYFFKYFEALVLFVKLLISVFGFWVMSALDFKVRVDSRLAHDRPQTPWYLTL